jgi:hypothetical protein
LVRVMVGCGPNVAKAPHGGGDGTVRNEVARQEMKEEDLLDLHPHHPTHSNGCVGDVGDRDVDAEGDVGAGDDGGGQEAPPTLHSSSLEV